LSGKSCDSAASAVDAPTDLRKARRAAFLGKIAPHHRRCNDAFVALFRTLVGHALEAGVLSLVVLSLAEMASARTP
jgi:hypothetical protein